MHKRNKLIIIAFFLILNYITGCHSKQTVTGSKKLFDLNWEFYAGTDNSDSTFNFSARKWRTIDLPHDWSMDVNIIKNNPTAKIVWYKKRFDIPSEWQHKQISVYFEGINKNPEVFLNGESLRVNIKENSSASCNLTNFLNYKKENDITVRIGITDKANSTGNSHAGIFKHVWLIISDSGQFGS